ncbi:MAG: PQQ-dependent sugar dehydrogenase [Betaproteobacteria bacterium]
MARIQTPSLRLLAAALAMAAAASPFGARADDALETLGGMHKTAPIDWPVIPQTGAKADQIRQNLEKVKLPPGFHIALYAIVPDARHMAVGPQGVVTIVGTRKSKAYAVTDRARSGVAEEVKEFAPSIPKVLPNGPCWSPDGFLYIVEQNRVLQYAAAEFFYEGQDVAVGVVVPEGKLIPTSEESFNHTARECRIGPDGKLYIQLGQPYNVPPKEKMDLYRQWGIGGIIRMGQDGKNREVYAIGMRNPVGMDFNPKDKTLWANDNQVDGMGDDAPPGELNHVTKAGQNFGFPWYGGGHVLTNEYKDQKPPADVVFPEVEQAAHAADLGLTFYTGKMFPAKYQGAIFSAQHGSWNRTVPVGARVLVTFLKPDGHVAGPSVPFAEGWNDGGHYLGRPVDVAQSWDGSLLVSDDLVGAIYRITYDGK